MRRPIMVAFWDGSANEVGKRWNFQAVRGTETGNGLVREWEQDGLLFCLSVASEGSMMAASRMVGLVVDMAC